MKKILCLGLFFALNYQCIKAQVINIEGKRFVKDTNGFVGKLDLNGTINQNTQQVLMLGTNIHAQYKHNRHRVLAITDMLFIKAGKQDFVNAGYQHFRYNYKLLKLVTWEAFVQGQYNQVLLLDRRYLAGTGPRFRLIKTTHLKLYAACLYMYEYQSQNHDAIHRYNNRLSAYYSINIDLPKIDFTSTTFYQPNIGDLNDNRIANDSSLEFEFSKHLNFKAGFNLLYDTRQPPGIPALTYSLRNGISIKI